MRTFDFIELHFQILGSPAGKSIEISPISHSNCPITDKTSRINLFDLSSKTIFAPNSPKTTCKSTENLPPAFSNVSKAHYFIFHRMHPAEARKKLVFLRKKKTEENFLQFSASSFSSSSCSAQSSPFFLNHPFSILLISFVERTFGSLMYPKSQAAKGIMDGQNFLPRNKVKLFVNKQTKKKNTPTKKKYIQDEVETKKDDYLVIFERREYDEDENRLEKFSNQKNKKKKAKKAKEEKSVEKVFLLSHP